MAYEIKVSHISEDYDTPADENAQTWVRRIEEPSELILLLNRIAIATTQLPFVDFPEVRISWESHHVEVRVIRGKLYYTELNSSNRKDLVVTPDEVIRLLEGQPIEQALRRDPKEDVYIRPISGGHLGTRGVKKALLWISLSLLAVSIFFSWRSLREQVRLVQAPNFVPTMQEEAELLRRYADVYVTDLREGATVLELTKDRELTIYDLWYSPVEKRYNLVPRERFSVSAGLHYGKPALLAGEVHLLELSGETLVLHGVAYRRYGKELSSLGDVLEKGF
jgi:hypothetical protein